MPKPDVAALRIERRLATGWLVLLLAAAPLSAGDWPQILGPLRTGIARDESLADRWPAGGPPVAWQRKVGSGFSGIAVAGDRAVLFHRVGNKEVVEAMNAATGKVIWTRSFPTSYVPSYTSDNGPRCVPTIHGQHVIVYGARGNLHCLDLASGKPRWSRDTFDDFSSKRTVGGEPPDGYFGIASSPIVEKDLVLVNIGGDTKRAGIVAFRLADGRTAWTQTAERASYSSPTAATIGGRRHVIFATRFNVVAVDPVTGAERFRFPFGRRGPNVTAANPLVIDDHVFITASYAFGAVLARVSANGLKEVWRSDEVLSSQYTTPILHEGRLYGIHGRQDQGRAALRCVDPKTKRVAWEKPGFGYATLIAADGKLVILKTDGTLVLVRLGPSKYQPLAEAAIFSSTARALPALSGGRLFARDGTTLKCVRLGRVGG